MAPRGVRADEHDQVGVIEILVESRHRVGAERASVARDRRRHAQARIGVDIGRADEALHQLVGDVIVLGQQLAREIERDRVRPVAFDDAREAVGHAIERLIPIDARERAIARAHHGVQQARLKPERLAERRALGAEPAEIRRMLRIARDRRAARPVRLPPVRRSRRRNTGRWCARPADGRRARSSINVLLVAALLLQLRHEGDRLDRPSARRAAPRCRPARARRPWPCAWRRRRRRMRAVGEPGPEVAADLAHAVLHVEFLVAVARPGEREAREHDLVAFMPSSSSS